MFSFRIDPAENELTVDRRKSGIVDFEESFGKLIHKQAYKPSDTLVEVRMIVDRSSIEIFVDEGRYVFTEQVFPKEPFTKLEIISKTASFLKGVEIFLVKPIWKENE